MSDNGSRKVEMENQIYAIPEHLMQGSGVQVRPKVSFPAVPVFDLSVFGSFGVV